MKVYSHKSKYSTTKRWYTATLSDGTTAKINFLCDIPEEFEKAPVFEISHAKGKMYDKDDYVTEDGRTIPQCDMDIYKCDFAEAVFDEVEEDLDDLDDIF